MEPFCLASELYTSCTAPLEPGKFDFYSNRAKEVAFRVFAASTTIGITSLCLITNPLLTLGAVTSWGATGKLLGVIGYCLQHNNFSHVRGRAEEKSFEDGNVNVLTWNVLGAAGGYHYTNGGCAHTRSKVDAIVEKLNSEENDPDVLILQEIYDTAFEEALIERLQDRYAHIFCLLGADVTFGSRGGVMVLTKGAVHDFATESYVTNDWTLNRGFGTLELTQKLESTQPFLRIIGTHFIHGNDDEAKNNRVRQLDQVIASLASRNHVLPTLLCGDLNIERDQEEGQVLHNVLDHSYVNHNRNNPKQTATCTNRLAEQYNPGSQIVWGETIDYISLFTTRSLDGRVIPNVENNDDLVQLARARLIRAYDPNTFDTAHALSDHNGLITTIHVGPRQHQD